MAKAINLNPVEPFVIEDGESQNLFRRFEIWLEELEIYVVASGITNKDQKIFYILLHSSFYIFHLGWKETT